MTWTTDALDEVIAYEAADKVIPSISYCLFDRNDVLAERHVVRRGEMIDKPLFRIGSVSKTFGAILAMQLCERGVLDLDADVATYLPGFAPSPRRGEGRHAISLRKLLSHRSGLTREAADGGYLDDRDVTLAETVDGLARSALKAPSDGSAYFYSNAGFAVVGRVIEAVTGLRYAEHLQVALLDPLGLRQTSIHLTAPVRSRLAPATMWTAGGDSAAPVFDLGSAPAGNIASSLSDIARWGQMLLGGRDGLIGADTLSRMWQSAGPDAARGYGLGFAIDRIDGARTVGHGGAVYGYSTAFALAPDAGLGAFVVGTLDFTGALASELARYALRTALAQRQNLPAPAKPARLAAAGMARAGELSGTYIAEDGDRLTLRAQGSRLMLERHAVPFELRPTDDGHFALDGRMRDTQRPSALAEVTVAGETLYWADRSWRRQREPAPPPEPAPGWLPYLGAYAPAFMPTRLFVDGSHLVCLIENLSPHVCEPLDDGRRFRLHGPMYEAETLEFCPLDAAGRAAIRVGEMRLAKLG